MISVAVFKQSNYPVSAPKIKKFLRDFFGKNGIVSNAEVSVSLVGEKKMLEMGRKYMKDGKLHNVLSFTTEETKEKFVYPPNNKVYLGEIIVCFPKALEEAKMENKLIEEKVLELIGHSALHLLGIHHE